MGIRVVHELARELRAVAWRRRPRLTRTLPFWSSWFRSYYYLNNSASADVQVTSLVDIGVVKQVSPTVSVAAGEPATYTVTTQNYGPSHAAGVTMVDTLPANAYLIGEPWGIGSGGSCRFADANEEWYAQRYPLWYENGGCRVYKIF